MAVTTVPRIVGPQDPASSALTVSSITVTGLTNPKIPYAGTGGLLTDSTLEYTSANIVSQVSGATAQTMNIYGTTSGAKYLSLTHNGTIGMVSTSSGNLNIQAMNGSRVVIGDTIGGVIQIDRATFNSVIPIANGTVDLGVSSTGYKRLFMDYTNTGTVGAVTINKAAGRVNVAAAGTSVVVTNSLVTAASEVFCTIATNDATATLKNVVAAAGSFTITLTAGATAQTSINFFVVNTD